MDLKFQNPNFVILRKLAFWNKQKWLNKELITWSGKKAGKKAACLMGQP